MKSGRVGSLREGSGLKRIHEECVATGIRVEFKRVKTGFVVVFYRPKWEEGEGLSGATQGKVVEKVAEKVVEKISTNQIKILEVIVKNPAISARELANLVGISPRKTQENMAKLKELGVLKRVGPDKGGHWEVGE